MKMLRFAGGAAAALATTVILTAQMPMMDVKMGLWEITTTVNMGNAMPQVDTSKMNDQQKAQLEAMMKAMAGKGTVTKSCMTREKYEKNSFMQPRGNQSCKQTITNNTRTAMDANVVCTSPASTATLHLEATSNSSFKGHVVSKSSERGREMEITIDMSGNWVSADCGDVK